MIRRGILLGLALAALGAGPGAAATAAPRDTLLVSAEWLAARAGAPDLVIVETGADSRSYDAGHIPGARFVPLGAIVTERAGVPSELPEVVQLAGTLEAAGISSTSRVVIYGDPLPAARLFFTLDYLGFGDRTSILDGGLAAWKRAGHGVTQVVPEEPSGRLDPSPRPDLVVTAEWVRAHLGDTNVVLIDARPEAEWRGDVPGAGITRPGHIPGAASLFWRITLTPPEPALLKDRAVLTHLFARTGARAGVTVVTYCRTGIQASWLYFVARYLGYPVRLYDGSFIEWSNQPEHPVER